MYVCMLLCLCLTSHQHLRSYGDRPWLKVSSDRLVKPGIEPATPGLQGVYVCMYVCMYYKKGQNNECKY